MLVVDGTFCTIPIVGILWERSYFSSRNLIAVELLTKYPPLCLNGNIYTNHCLAHTMALLYLVHHTHILRTVLTAHDILSFVPEVLLLGTCLEQFMFFSYLLLIVVLNSLLISDWMELWLGVELEVVLSCHCSLSMLAGGYALIFLLQHTMDRAENLQYILFLCTSIIVYTQMVCVGLV